MHVRRGRHRSRAGAGWPRTLAREALDLAEFVGFYFVMGTVLFRKRAVVAYVVRM